MSRWTDWNAQGFEARVGAAGMPVVVQFWAPQCTASDLVAPILDALAAEYAGRVLFARVNVEEAIALARGLGVEGTPTVCVFDGLTMVDRRTGTWPLRAYRDMLERALLPYTV